jgi:hypothetical protein
MGGRAHPRRRAARGGALPPAWGRALPPRGIPAFIGGATLGALAGTVLALVAQLGGCAVAFLWAQLIGRRLGSASPAASDTGCGRCALSSPGLPFSRDAGAAAAADQGTTSRSTCWREWKAGSALPFLAASALGTADHHLSARDSRSMGIWRLSVAAVYGGIHRRDQVLAAQTETARCR